MRRNHASSGSSPGPGNGCTIDLGEIVVESAGGGGAFDEGKFTAELAGEEATDVGRVSLSEAPEPDIGALAAEAMEAADLEDDCGVAGCEPKEQNSLRQITLGKHPEVISVVF